LYIVSWLLIIIILVRVGTVDCGFIVCNKNK
jgi:hypothetical protein